MDAMDTLAKSIEATEARHVFGATVERDGTVLLPTALVTGTGGGGGLSGIEANGEGARGGSGFAFRAQPWGAFVIRGDRVRWLPAINVNKIIAGGQAVAVTAIAAFTLSRWFARPRFRRLW